MDPPTATDSTRMHKKNEQLGLVPSTRISRRHLLGAAGSLIAAPTFAAPPKSGSPASFAADIIVVGYGAAGAAATIEAARAGSRVLILEKSPQDGHCSTTRLSAGIYQCPDRDLSRDLLAHYIASTYVPRGSTAYRTGSLDPELYAMAQTWAELAPQTYRWLTGLDGDFRRASSPLFSTPLFMSLWDSYRPHIEAQISTYGAWDGFNRSTYGAPKAEQMNGEALYTCLAAGIAALPNISIAYESPAQELITEGDRVIGVRAQTPSGTQDFYARQAVILACGGFAFNESMRSALLPASGNRFWAVSSSPANTGDGIAMALRLGAAVVTSSIYFDRFCILLPIKVNGVRLGVPLECMGSPHSILVDNYGRRFAREYELRDSAQHYGFSQDLLQFDASTLSFPHAPAWLIFDEQLRQFSPIATLGEGSTVCGLVGWSPDNHEALEMKWMLRANTVAELAQAISQHPDNAFRMTKKVLTQTVESFNRGALESVDPEFDRAPASLGTIARGPFYALPVSIDVPHMGAGLKTNRNRQVLRWDNQPIPGLYAAGETAPVSRFVHDRGGHLSECLVFGRYVGKLTAGLPKRGQS